MSNKLPKINDEKLEAEVPLVDSNSPFIFTDKMLEEDFDELYRKYPLTDDTTCGLGFVRGRFLQK